MRYNVGTDICADKRSFRNLEVANIDLKMAERNHLCEAQNCTNTATAFGLKGTLKTRSCDLHMPPLIAKKMTVYSIDGYDFISNPHDAAVFEERKTTIDTGLDNLASLEANIDKEYRATLQLLETEKGKLLNTVEAIFLEIEDITTKRYQGIKDQIPSLATNLNEYVKLRENALNSAAELLCGEMKATPLFINLVIEDFSIPVSRAINQYWSVSVGSIESLLKIAVSLPLQPATVESAREYHQNGLNYYNSSQWKEAEENYLQAKAIYEKCAPQSTDAATNLDDLGSLLKYARRWSEAEACHRQVQAIFERNDPQSLEAARNHHNYGCLCKKLNRLDEAEQHYQESKRICEATGKQEYIQAKALYELGLIRMNQKRYNEAVEFFRQAQPIYEATSPQSSCAASNYFQLGYVYHQSELWKESEESYLHAKRIYEAIVPQSTDIADCLYNLGFVYEAQNFIEKSIDSFRSAGELYALNNKMEWKMDTDNSILRLQAK